MNRRFGRTYHFHFQGRRNNASEEKCKTVVNRLTGQLSLAGVVAEIEAGAFTCTSPAPTARQICALICDALVRKIAALVIWGHLALSASIVMNVLCRKNPRLRTQFGVSTLIVLRVECLRLASQIEMDVAHRIEHVTPWLRSSCVVLCWPTRGSAAA
jgi:hypothetical protein